MGRGVWQTWYARLADWSLGGLSISKHASRPAVEPVLCAASTSTAEQMQTVPAACCHRGKVASAKGTTIPTEDLAPSRSLWLASVRGCRRLRDFESVLAFEHACLCAAS